MIPLKFIIKTLILIMIFFNTAYGKYEKIFFDNEAKTIDGEKIKLNIYKDKVVLLVNTASYCGFTNQYNELQLLWEKYEKDGLIVLGVPSNSFNQEKKNNSDIKKFCEVNFNISFPLLSISNVKGNNAHNIYKWAKENHGKSAIPKWNFHKILIDRNGKIFDTYSSFTKPNSKKIITAIENLLY
tara:strand:+ start:286 stop:837 length:552 start_codon:yes stop_codon:yes gene_type:complete